MAKRVDPVKELEIAREDIGSAIREFRLSKGLSQREFAAEYGISQARLAKLEQGNYAHVSADALLKALFATGFRWEDIGSVVGKKRGAT